MCMVEEEWSRGGRKEKGGGLVPCVCVRQLKLADLIRRVGPNEWGSTLEWCSGGPVWVVGRARGPEGHRITQTGRVALHCSEACRMNDGVSA